MMPLEDALDARITVALTMPVAPLAQLRKWLADALAHLAEDVVQDLLLICTELVANAYDHALAPRRLRMHRVDGGARLRIEVDDSSPDRLPTLGQSSVDGNRGRGLMLVDALSQRCWGVQPSASGKTVWAEVPLT